ncbi:sigma-70 family RNA polymerase sigma factor [Paenibacillus puerhi]|uniref:sigma-70 family RNA polymerase sigma factor n=1 Tax=Paenibacillus puerhi TaxID=2692622 RepID=UPI00135AD702|nr:sigma-70 family RNA polymerase sigma factor [Paenibacillus puerhi]
MDWKAILFKYSIRIAGNHWDAEDLTQDAWLKLIEALRKQPNRPVSNAFLYRIVKNAWIDLQRKGQVRTVPLAESHEGSSPDPSLSSWELLEVLAELLPPKMAVILLFMDVFDYTAKETAEFLGMKDAAVQVTLGRARRRLKELAASSGAKRPNPAHTADSIRLDALVGAFRRRDPDDMYKAFIGLTRQGIQLTRLRKVGGSLHFTFRDPDGNVFQVISNLS